MNKIFALGLLIMLIACSKDDEKPTVKQVSVSKLEGKIEKGPFTQGSTVTVQELTKDLTLTGKSFQTDITNNEGIFKLESALNFVSPYIQISCDGYFFDEVRGELSESQIRLEAIVDISDKTSMNVNILTHLSKDRIIKLMKEDGTSFKEASSQAQEELLTCFGLQAYKDQPFDNLSISKGDKGAGALIVISSIMLADRKEAELTEYISTLKETFKTNGTFTDQEVSSIRKTGKELNLDDISSNIVERYNELKKEVSVPDLKYFIDWDSDGIAGNKLGDPDLEKQLSFETDTLYISETGGEYKVKINANVPFKYNAEADQNGMIQNELLTPIDFSKKEVVGKEMVIRVNSSSKPFHKPASIVITTYDGSVSSELVVIQEGYFSNELSDNFTKQVIEKAAKAFELTHTQEAYYTNCFSTNDVQWSPFTAHNINASNSKIKIAWAYLYQLNRDLNVIQQYTGKNSTKYISSLKALLYYHLTVLWGNVPFITKPVDLADYRPVRTSVSEIYVSLQTELRYCIDNMINQKSSSFFKVDKNVPKALLAKILLQQKKYAEAYRWLREIIDSNRYALNSNPAEALGSKSTELIYAINPADFSMPNYGKIANGKFLPLIQYSEVLLMAAECSIMRGDIVRARELLNRLRNREGLGEIFGSSHEFISELKKTWKSTMKGGFSYFAFLKRNGLATSELGINDYQLLYPIPDGESITQNPGY